MASAPDGYGNGDGNGAEPPHYLFWSPEFEEAEAKRVAAARTNAEAEAAAAAAAANAAAEKALAVTAAARAVGEKAAAAHT
jgi:hypothetical protein